MAIVTREFFEELQTNKMIEHGDWVKLAKASVEAGLNGGEGHAPATFRNAVVKGFSTSDEVVGLVLAYFEPRAKAIAAQRASVQSIRETLNPAS